MIHNYTGFFGWQGNNDQFHSWIKWVVLAMAFLLMISVWIFREKIALRFDNNKKILFFKKQSNFWRTIGVIGLSIVIFRLILVWTQGYPLYWEGLTLHLCRLHLIILFIMMIFNKVEWIKNLTYIAIVGALFGIFFNNSHSDVINSGYGAHTPSGEIDWTKYKTYEDMPAKWTQLEKLSYLDHITSYGTGFDNFFLYEFITAHLSLIFFPLFIRAAYRLKMSNKEFFRMQIAYTLLTLFIWVFNIALGNVSNPRWRSNNWYIGLDANNDESNALGPLSAWPQNLFAYIFIGYVVMWSFHSLWFLTSKFRFFEREKWYQVKIVKSKPRQDFLNGFHKGWFKELFIFKQK